MVPNPTCYWEYSQNPKRKVLRGLPESPVGVIYKDHNTGSVKLIRTLFKEPISSTIKPEIPSSLVSNESSCSLLSDDVPEYEIWKWKCDSTSLTVM